MISRVQWHRDGVAEKKVVTVITTTTAVIDQNFEEPDADIKETAPARGYMLRPPNRTPDGRGLVPSRVSLALDTAKRRRIQAASL
jgi:hypothetical protein